MGRGRGLRDGPRTKKDSKGAYLLFFFFFSPPSNEPVRIKGRKTKKTHTPRKHSPYFIPEPSFSTLFVFKYQGGDGEIKKPI